MMKHIFLSGCFSFIVFQCVSQGRITKQQYIEKYRGIAVEEMLSFKIPASITLAQGMLESADGNSKLALHANNHFGVKCQGEWDGPTYHQDDDSKNECFRKYKNPEQSYKDHSNFLSKRERYADLFKLNITNYQGWAKGLKKAGYATNPKYPELLIKLIEDWKLNEYDNLDKIPSEWHHKSAKQSNNIEAKQRKENHKNLENVSNRATKLINNIKSIKIIKGDTWNAIANEFGMGTWEIYRYNEFDKTKNPIVGETIYLQPKRRKSNENCHVVAEGETVWGISQQYGVKEKLIRKRNKIVKGGALKKGQKIKLKVKGCK